MGLSSDHWTSRFKTEEILEVHCPKCHAKPQEWCDRDGEKLGRRARAMARAGTPPSHQERMWLRQGHEEREFPALLAKQKPGWEPRWAGSCAPSPAARPSSVLTRSRRCGTRRGARTTG